MCEYDCISTNMHIVYMRVYIYTHSYAYKCILCIYMGMCIFSTNPSIHFAEVKETVRRPYAQVT